MERTTSKHEETGREPGGEVSGLQNGDDSPESTEQGIRASSSPRASSSLPKIKHHAPVIDHSTGQADPTAHSAVASGMLPPISIRGETGRERKDTRSSSHVSLKTAATAVLSAETIRNFRRSSASMHVDLLRVFVPDMLINYLENASKPLESQAFFVKAACMCADISGFTALSEKHCKKGTAGLDTLVQIINSYYSNLVNIVYSFGGDIIKIAGDALYCVFMPDEHDLRGAVLCAALCSMQLRDVAADGLTLHVGISCGELCFGILGGIDNYWECLMSGEPIGLVADALDEAKKQEVVVSVECMSIIGDCCRGTPLPSRNVLLHALEPPRKEKRGSVRMANMIANKGLPVELESTEGLFAGRAAAAAAVAAVAAAATTNGVAAKAAADPVAAEGAEAGEAPGTTDGGTPAEAPAGAEAAAAAAAAAAKPTTAARGAIGGTGTGRVVDANAAWISSNAKAKERSAGSTSDQALGAAGKMRAEVSSGVLPMLQGFVPGPVTDLLAAGIFMYMAEMRTVTTLFVKLESYSPEKHKNLLSLQIHLTTIQKILAEHEGFLRQFLVDDKGCVLIACWGVPGRSYPDNGNRCLAAAVEIHASLQVRDMKTSMGITTGHALCGRMGGKIRSEYAMVGDVINLAARLMGKAKGRIVCDEVTHDLVCTNETMVALFKRLDPMMLKGKEHPIAPFVCIAQQGSDMWETHKQLRMIGRIKLQNSVNACLDLIDKGDNIDKPEPAVVVIEGAHGTGKSMVADRVKKSASQFFRRKVHMYTMVQAQSRTPYAGINGMLRTIFGLDHLGDDAFAVKQALLKTVRNVYGSAEPSTQKVAIGALKTAFGVDLAGETEVDILQTTRRPSMEGMLPLHVVQSVITELATHALGTLPAVFILDNVHLMDKMSWKLLIQFLYCPLRVLLVLTATPVAEDIKKRKDLFHAKKESQFLSPKTADGPNSAWHGDHGEVHLHMQQYIRATQLPITKKFTLSPFNKEELRQLLEHTLAPQDRSGVTTELVDTVYGLSGGNPYWCVEVVRFIKENSVGIFLSRIAVQEDGASGAGAGDVSTDGDGDGDTGTIASSPEDAMMGKMGILVVCRFERLLVEEQSVVRYASIAGLEFSLSLLHAVLPRNIRPQLELIIQALVTARFVVYSRHTYYKFQNSMVHMVLYNLTPASSRKRMHKAVAQHYIINHGDDPLYLPVMTYHLLQARVEPNQALKFVCKTAAHALVALCYEDCMEALEKAVEFASCTSEIHAVLFVHHYISMMHERGHTIARHASNSAAAGKDGRGPTNCDGRDSKDGSGPGKTSGDPDTTAGSVINNSNSNSNGDDGGGAEGRGSEGLPPLTQVGELKVKMVDTSFRPPEERRRTSGASRATVDEPHSRSSRDFSRRTIASDCGSCATEAQMESLGNRIARFAILTKEPHARLCSAGQFCPILQGTFPSPRQQAVDDEHADSLRKHPIPVSPRPPKLASAAGGLSDFFEEPVMLQDGEGEGEGEGDASREENLSGASSYDQRSAKSGQYLRGHEEGTSSLRSSLGWELAHLLHVCLGHYIKPGGPSPGFPEAPNGSFSISMHRLPPEAGEGAAFQPHVSDDEDAHTTTQRISSKTAPVYGRGRNSGVGMRGLRSKVSTAKMLLSEHGSAGSIHTGLSLQSTASTFRQSLRAKLRWITSGLHASSLASTAMVASPRGNSVGTDAQGGIVGRVKLLPMATEQKYEAPPTSGKTIGAAGAGGGSGDARGTDAEVAGTAPGRHPERPTRSSVCVIS